MIASPIPRVSCGWVQRNAISVACLVACVFWVSAVAAQISPGPLSKYHESLNGTFKCTQCHQFGGSSPQFKCLDCHKEIAARISSGRGFHAGVVRKTDGSQTCRTCHGEHYGADVQLIKWIPSQQKFDHSRTGWPLVGHHAQQTCSKCHTPEKMVAEERSVIKIQNVSQSFLGLNRNCLNCHKDHHQGKFGTDCSKCHTPMDWKGAKEGFDHAKTGYPLTGLHTKVDCIKCHTPGDDGKARFVELKHDDCLDCHKSPHGTAFRDRACSSCHTTEGFKHAIPKNFDHSRTKFALVGKHATLECEKCHQGGSFGKPLQFALCSNCHNPSPHAQQFAARADGGECSACHDEKGFKPTKFVVANHAQTKYPLEGKHATLECAKCHVPAQVITVTSNPTVYRLKFAACNDCHQDKHRKQFVDAPYLNRCQICHTVTGFNPSKFNVDAHKATRYPLLGAHIKVECDACHKLPGVKDTEQALQFKFNDMSCTACHKDPHKDEFHDIQIKLTKAGTPAGCEACHTLDSWQATKGFDHSTTRFSLLGGHRTAKCADCHKPQSVEGKLVNADFHVVPNKCETCHVDVHGAQFNAGEDAKDCSPCHNSFRWKPATFDHDTQSSYKLLGEHRDVPCAKCHFSVRTIATKPVLFYKPLSTECSACHGNKKMKELEEAE